MMQRPGRGSSARLECGGGLQHDGDPAVQIVDGLPADSVAACGGIDDGHPAPRCRLQHNEMRFTPMQYGATGQHLQIIQLGGHPAGT
ncbi:MAG: hypothetical protein QOD88_2007 [Mycobacterium sp.]|nr:hypothetical protein [Mycobacterium sp.]